MSNAKPEIDEARARELLGRERERIESSLADKLGRLRPSELEEIDTENELEDEGEQIEEEQVDDALVAQLRAELEAVERAEARLSDGTYGLSVESGAPIPAERLETIPWAERTPEEQERFERTRGGAL
jgi:RNA polymerase-binding transcription factor